MLVFIFIAFLDLERKSSFLDRHYLVKLFAMKKMQTVHRGVRAGLAGIAVVSPDLPPVAGGKEVL